MSKSIKLLNTLTNKEQNLYCVKQDAEAREGENNAVRNFS